MTSLNMILSRENTRGKADHGWLKSAHSFSFGSYFNPSRMGFGALRVLNDDIIDPGTGFDTHSHSNMEIISIVLNGKLRHQDSGGHEYILTPGDVQVMSAGRGIAHSEYNASQEEQANFLQIWVIPNRKDGEPSYQQKMFPEESQRNRFQTIASSNAEDGSLKILQDAKLSLATIEKNTSLTYKLENASKGVYCFLISGKISAGNEPLNAKDAIELSGAGSIDFFAHETAKLLAIEVPLKA